ncbi:hypothetical protein M885DRAFT_62634 [Pelagophyceae sp. CCMP2097]|nr:hypothetical protein M885DRAFT_62634 [Pelagophyceae sp. CCMP2097]
MATEFRGLKHFIEEVKLCPDAALEKKRVDSELSKIRGKFAAAAPLSSYAGKKYIWKLVYASVLGYDVDFGHAEAVGLMASADAAEKAVGYLAVSVLAASKTEGKWRRLFSATVANDCASGNAHAVALALAAAANGCSGVDQAQVLRACVATARKLVVDAKSPADVVRRAALLVSRFEAMRSAERAAKRPPDAPTDFVDAADRARWAAAVGRMLERETTTLNLPPPPPPSPRRGFLMMSSKGPSKNVAPPPAVRWGVLLSLVTMISAAPDDADDSLVQSSMAPCAKLLSAIERTKSAGRGSFDHEYHGVCAPWLRAKLLRVLSRRRITALDGGKDIFLDDGDFVKSVFGYYQGLIDDLAVGNNGALRLRDPLDAARRDQSRRGAVSDD